MDSKGKQNMPIKDPNSEHLQQIDSIDEHYMSPTLFHTNVLMLVQTFVARGVCFQVEFFVPFLAKASKLILKAS